MESNIAEEAVDAARSRRVSLHSLLVELEAAIAAAAPGRETAWTADVRAALDRLAPVFADHVSATEAPDGLFDKVRRRAPRLDHQVRVLAAEHETITAEVENAKAALDEVAGAREAVLSLLARLARHRQLCADLVYEAYAVDLGGSD